MIITAPYASLFSIILMICVIMSVEKWVRKGRILSKEIVDFRKEYTSFLNDRFRNWRAIKVSSAEEQEINFCKSYAKKFFDYSVDLVKNSGKNIVIVTPVMTTQRTTSCNKHLHEQPQAVSISRALPVF